MILAYHKVAPVAKTHWWITVDRFYEQMHALQARQVVTLDEYDPANPANPAHAVITFDGVYDNIHRYALPVLKHFGYPFELFVIGGYIGGENDFDQQHEPPCRFASEDMLRDMCAHGGRVQWHTRSHRRFSTLSSDEALAELSPPDALAEAFPEPNMRWFAFPHGDVNPAHREAIRERFVGALACDDGDTADRFNLPRKLVFQDTSLFRATVAAIVANYNYGRYLREAVDSLERQSSRPDEVLIIDDASTDDSETVLRELEAKGYRVVRNEKNLGIVGNFAKAVSLTKSDYVFFLGADNRLRHDYVLRCRTALDADPDAAIAYSDMTLFGPLAGKLAKSVDAEEVAARRLETESIYRWRMPEPEGEALENFAERNFVHGSSLYRRSFYDKVGGYRDSSGPEDHHLFHRMWQAGGGLIHIADPLLEYRQHSLTQANTALSAALEIRALRAALAARQEPPPPPSPNPELERRLSSLRLRIAELEDNNARIRSSGMWPLIRVARPLRKRFKRAAQITQEMRLVAGDSVQGLAMASNGSAGTARSALIEALPQIAQNFRDHGMRPGHWVAPEVTKGLQRHGFTLVANTFYAVTPDLNELDDREWRQDKYAAAWDKVRCRPIGEMLGKLAPFMGELADVPIAAADEDGQFYWDNPMFSPLDASAYYGVIRALRPRRIIEVGSGYSTAVALMAGAHAAPPVEISCIEPYPSAFLLKQKRKLKTLIERKIQDVDPLIFETLEAGDVLFIDSSHCSRLGSDLNFLMFEAIPRLKPGVRVHFHDIFLPCEYPRSWLEEIGIMWNEQYMLLAFLMFNDAFEVIWSSSLAGARHRDGVEALFQGVLPKDAAFINNLGAYSGGSLWLEKLK